MYVDVLNKSFCSHFINTVPLISSINSFSGVLSAIATAIVTSIMWCVMKKRYKHPQSALGHGTQDDKSGTHVLKSITTRLSVLKTCNK